LCVLSIPVTFLLDLAILKLISAYVGDFITVNGVRHITEDYLGMYVFVPLAGVLSGLLQYAVLRRRLPRMGGWVLATPGGWLLGSLLIALPGRLGWTDILLTNIPLMFLAMGFSVGMAQWLLLRRRLPRAGWWIPASILGWGALGLILRSGGIGMLGIAGMGFLPGCATAAVLWLLMERLPAAGGRAA
jgi:hypothetical protein